MFKIRDRRDQQWFRSIELLRQRIAAASWFWVQLSHLLLLQIFFWLWSFRSLGVYYSWFSFILVTANFVVYLPEEWFSTIFEVRILWLFWDSSRTPWFFGSRLINYSISSKIHFIATAPKMLQNGDSNRSATRTASKNTVMDSFVSVPSLGLPNSAHSASKLWVMLFEKTGILEVSAYSNTVTVFNVLT